MPNNNFIPYSFPNKKDALAAESKVNNKFFTDDDDDGPKAYATERMLYVPEQKSFLYRTQVDGFIKQLGGSKS